MKFLKDISPREYQQRIFETCKEQNCLVVLPTGLGKTLIALMLTIERMQKFPSEKVVFLAPTKPLAEQHLKYFQKHLPELFAEMILFTGAVNASKRKQLWQNSDIIFSTPQCVANDVKNKLYDLSEVSLLVEDEAHRCLKNYDYNFLAQRYKEQAQHPRVLGMTASPGSSKEKIQEICKNLHVKEVELRTRESSDVKEYLQKLEFEKVVLEFPPEFEEIKQVLKQLINQYIEELRKRKVLYGVANKITLIELQKKIMGTIARGNKNFSYLLAASACAQAIKLQHALELLETQTLTGFGNYLKELIHQAEKQKSKGVVKLVNKPEFQFISQKTNELLTKGFEHPKLEEIIRIVSREKKENKKAKLLVFTQFRETATIITKHLNKLQSTMARVFVGQAKKIGSHGSESGTTGLSQREQQEIIKEFTLGTINVLVATSIGEEGLDIPEVNVVIFYEAVPSAIRKIQRAGRTARLMKGKLIILITKNTRDESYYYASRSREKSMYKAIDSIKDDLKNNKLESQKKLGELI